MVNSGMVKYSRLQPIERERERERERGERGKGRD